VYVPAHLGGNAYGLRFRPTKIIYTGDGSSYIDHLRYTSYGGARATATGVDEVDDCSLGCAGGRYHAVPAHVVLWHLARCGGRQIYAMFKIDAPGARRYNTINPFTVDLRYGAGCPAP
jgi:hypothetical protein